MVFRNICWWLLLLVTTSYSAASQYKSEMMKATADSILVSYFGEAFVDNYLHFDSSSSNYYTSNAVYCGSWKFGVDKEPTYYRLAYDISPPGAPGFLFDVRLTLDTTGRLLLSDDEFYSRTTVFRIFRSIDYP